MKAKLRSDKRKNPEYRDYRLLTLEECKALSGHCLILDRYDNIADVKITSVKTWKTRPFDVEVHCKFGMYEYFTVRIDQYSPNSELVKEVE